MGIEVETNEIDPIAALLESGKIPENASVTDIAAILAGEEPQAAAAATDAAAGDAGAKTEGDADATQAAEQAAATDEAAKAATAENTSARDQQTTEVEAPIAGPNGSTIPYGVLKGARVDLADARRKLEEVEQERTREREAREKAERERDELQTKLSSQQTAATQATKEVQAAASAAGVTGDVRTVDIAKLRDNFPAEVVDAIEALQTQLSAQTRELNDLRGRDAKRQEDENTQRANSQQEDIDSVSKLAEWQLGKTAKDKAMWAAAEALDDELRADPTWKDKPRIERYQEIVNQLGGGTQQQQQQSTGSSASGTTKPAAAGKNVDEALAAAAARAVPISHSGLPAGSPPAQSEAQSLEQLDVTQVANKFAGMTDDQIEALLSRI